LSYRNQRYQLGQPWCGPVQVHWRTSTPPCELVSGRLRGPCRYPTRMVRQKPVS